MMMLSLAMGLLELEGLPNAVSLHTYLFISVTDNFLFVVIGDNT